MDFIGLFHNVLKEMFGHVPLLDGQRTLFKPSTGNWEML